MWIVGVDAGESFTDLCLTDGRSLRVAKVPSGSGNPEEAVTAGLDRAGVPEGSLVIHGAAVGAGFARDGSEGDIVLLVTEGFEDVLTIGRDEGAPETLAHRCLGVPERTLPTGGVAKELDRERLDEILKSMPPPPSAAVCLLHSYANPRHELLVAEAVARVWGCPVSLSSEISPWPREVERASTAAINARLVPGIQRYLQKLEGPGRRIVFMNAAGGWMSAAEARRVPVRTVLSGRAAGVLGAFSVARKAGFTRILTLDVGGASAWSAACPGEVPKAANARFGGHPVQLPLIAVRAVGKGGGAVVALDSGGILKAGPRTAEPACHGRGGPFTITDAHLLLGHIRPGAFADGSIALQRDPAHRAAHRLAEAAGLDVPALAEGALQVAEAGMERNLRRLCLEGGLDPGDFILVAFGGAGPLHACSIAKNLDIARVLIPPFPGALSSMGLLTSAPAKECLRGIRVRADRLDPADLHECFSGMEEAARREMDAPDGMELEKTVDMRYEGREPEVEVPFGADLAERFHRFHHLRYGFSDPGRPVEVLRARLHARGPAPLAGALPLRAPSGAPAGPCGAAELLRRGRKIAAPIYRRENLTSGQVLNGPAVIEEYSATGLIEEEWMAQVDPSGALILDRKST